AWADRRRGADAQAVGKPLADSGSRRREPCPRRARSARRLRPCQCPQRPPPGALLHVALARPGAGHGGGHDGARRGQRAAAGRAPEGIHRTHIHGEIYRARPDVMAVVHSHSSSVIPFGVTRTKLRPIYHMGSFLWSGAPVFEIRAVRAENDLLIRDRPLGQALAGTLGGRSCVLMRGHGMTVVGYSVPEAVFGAIYTQMNARLQLQAGQLEGPR